MRNTPKRQAARNRKIAWNTAIAEGRMLRSQGGLSFAMFATRADALEAVQRIQLAGMEADIVDPSLADVNYLTPRCTECGHACADAQSTICLACLDSFEPMEFSNL